MNKIKTSKIPEYVTHVTQTLEEAGFEAYIVGGCVRDLLLSRDPKDWDVTTNAKPDEIIPLFKKTVYENKFGTVAVIHETVSGETYQIEVTPYRIEAKYSDFRHPDEVKFSKKIEDDLKRRDFTINAMAFSSKGHLIDLYKGQEDLKDKIIRTVGTPSDRFEEDALRMLRAVRFSAQLGFTISHETMEEILKKSDLIKKISFERIRDEFTQIIMSENSVSGVAMLSKLGLLKHIMPELEQGIECEQGGEHIYDVYEHLLHALGHSTDKGWSFEVRLAALFHDIGKPKSRRPGEKKEYTFYGHEVVGARITKKIMERLKYPKKTTNLVVSYVRNHMFFSDTEIISLSAVRRVVKKVGKENIWKLMQIRECDRVGMNKKEAPYRLRKYHSMIEQVLRDPISVNQLKINGEIMMNELKIKPSPRMGWILYALLEKVLDDPKNNTEEYLKNRALELNKLTDKELKKLGEIGRDKKDEVEGGEISKIQSKYKVR
ncbi:MAG: HD domain-containing protein [Patescibacteria group bacterium]|nr:HD domain-containing protein [Patescibacteria group bacterium]